MSPVVRFSLAKRIEPTVLNLSMGEAESGRAVRFLILASGVIVVLLYCIDSNSPCHATAHHPGYRG